jgi:hypothetical protein
MLQDWTEPQVALVLSGEQHGHLEPCGCSERQAGGLSRRADLVRQLHEKGWPVVGLDVGGTLKRTRRQSLLKFDVTREILSDMGYRGLALGVEELKLGTLPLFEAYSQSNVKSGFDLPFLAANVTFFDSPDLGTPLDERILEAGGLKIGVTAVFGNSYRGEIVNADPAELRIDDPQAALPEVLNRLKAQQADILVLLAHAKPDESAALARAFPDFDLVVTAGGPEDPDGIPEMIGRTMLLRVGTKGKNVGVVGIYREERAKPTFRFEVVELDRFRFRHAPGVDERMRAYQSQLASEFLAKVEPTVPHERGADLEFTGAERCSKCHTKAYSIWSKTRHAHAYESLTVAWAKTAEDPTIAERMRMDRFYDPECLCCHTTGWDPQEVVRYNTGFVSLDETDGLAGNQCENCHGPGSLHSRLEDQVRTTGVTPEVTAARLAMHLEKEAASTQLCVKCHDENNSPLFNFEKYWPKVEHKGKD